jgi:hypothetical protein
MAASATANTIHFILRLFTSSSSQSGEEVAAQ